MTRMVLSALCSHWWRHPGQLLTLVLGLSLATALWSAVQAINAEARASYDAAAAVLTPVDQPILEPRDGGRIPLDRYVELRRAGWQVSAVIDGRARIGNTFVTVMGVDMLSSPALPPDLIADDAAAIAPVDLFSAPGVGFVAPETAARIGAKTDGPRIEVSDAVPAGILLTDIAVAARMLDRHDTLDRLFVLPDRSMTKRPLDEVAPELRLTQSTSGADTDTARLTDSFHLNLTAFGLLSFAVGLFIVHGTIGLAHEQRRPMLRTLRALGVPVRTLIWTVGGELIALALLSGLLGVAVGYVIAAALLPDVAATLRGLYGADTAGSLSLRPSWVFAGLGMALAGTAVSSIDSLWRLKNMPILSGASVRSWAVAAGRSARWQAAGGALLLILGLIAILAFGGLIAGFALLAGMLMGAALLLPPILSILFTKAAQRARHPLAQWLWSDMRAQLPGLSLALMALLLALAANIGVGTMVSSFRLTFTGWLDQRLASDLYISTESDHQTAALRDYLTPRVDGMVPIRHVDTEIGGQRARIYGIVDDVIYRNHWPLLEAETDVWDEVTKGEAALVNEQMARRLGLGLGDMVSLGAAWSLPLAGIYSDYGNPNGQVIVGLDRLLVRYPDTPDRQIGIRAPPEELPSLMADIRERFDLPGNAMVDQATIKAMSLSIFERTFLVTGALNVLTLGIAGFAILTALLTLWTMRLPQLAPVWALGLTRARLSRLEILRSLCLAALTFGLALPLGLVLAWVLLAVINVEAFGWRLPMYVFPLDWLKLGALALLAGGLAAIIPARRLARVPPARLLRIFSDDR
ncbi:MAG: ABC transporter permease [Pseudomonadota bacterium]